MPDASALNDSRPLDSVSRLLAAAAVAALAVCAHRWATDGFPSHGTVSPVEIAAIAGVSAILAGANLPFLVRTALHLGALWLLRQTIGEPGNESIACGLLLVSAVAFFSGLTAFGLRHRPNSHEAPDDRPWKLSTGDLLAALFAFSAYVAVAQHEASTFGPETLHVAESAVVYALLPYLVLIGGERLIGRTNAAVALCLAAAVVTLIDPYVSFADPFATVLVVAFRIASRPPATATEFMSTRIDRSPA